MAVRSVFVIAVVANIFLIVSCRVKKCPINEEYSRCTQSLCRAQNCTEKGESVQYLRVFKRACKKGCVCKYNYLRAANGTCIPEDQCPLNCDENEIVDNCPADCSSDYCPTREGDTKACSTPDPCPPPACKCAFNHRKARNGTCIPTRSCPPFDCSARPNEEFNPCPPLCPTDDCSQASPSGECPPLFGNIGIVLPCSPECRCIKGYWRKDGICAPYGECPGVCQTHERYSTCIQSECRALNCTQKNKSIPCPRIRPEACISGCVCEERYLRAADGNCVPEDQCQTKECPINEEYSRCTQSLCRPQNCTEKGESVQCPRVLESACKKGCVCKQNYLRAENGTCIPEDQCPLNCGENEIVDNCPADCSSDYCPTREGDTKACSTPDPCPPPACKCLFNHRRARNGTCIPTRSCPPFDCSARPNEEFNPCPPLCPTDDCSQASPSGECPHRFGRIGIVLPCNPKCRCIKGSWRKDGICVPYGECPGVCPSHERYSTCIQGECRALNCTQKDESIPCPKIRPEACISGCVCEEGYLRLANGTCVTEDQCQTDQCPTNEEYSRCTQSLCKPQNCTEKGEHTECPRVLENACKKGCVCKQNYLRAENGTCIPEDQCPLNCGENEIVDNCPADCSSDYCPTREGDTEACSTPDPCPPPACKCVFNHRKARNGTCIPTRSCPPFDCSARPNEEFNPCPPLCPTDDCSQASPSGECPPLFGNIGIVLPCSPECRCIKGYWRKDGICVPYGECPGVCQTHERYSTCIQGECRALNCTQKNKSIPCPRIRPEACISGCVCEEGYLRAADGNCVPEDQCQTPSCPVNEVYTDNKVSCPPNTCMSLVARFKCDENQPVESGCVCASGFLRVNKTITTCIPICKCPEMKYSPDCPVNNVCL